MSAQCSRCPQRIVWAKTATGKSMPVDVEPAGDGNIVLIETRGGTQAIVVKNATEFPDLKRYRSHFSTCPAAAAFRKPKEKRA